SLPHERIDALREAGVRSGFGNPLLRVGYIKVFMDGTLGSQTAWMLDGSGVKITSGEELAEIARRAAEAGLPLGVPAIGDRANRGPLRRRARLGRATRAAAAGGVERSAGARGDDRRAGLACPRRAPPRQAAARVSRRPGRARPRPARLRARRAGRGPGRGDDA